MDASTAVCLSHSNVGFAVRTAKKESYALREKDNRVTGQQRAKSAAYYGLILQSLYNKPKPQNGFLT